MDYQQYTEADFIKDEYFCRWVLNPDDESNHFWNMWLTNHPEKASVVNKARYLLTHINYKNRYVMDDFRYTRVLEKIMRHKGYFDNRRQDRLQGRSSVRWLVSVAAVAALLIVSVFVLHQRINRELPITEPEFIVKETPDGSRLTAMLPDGSKVIINANSSIRYKKDFAGQQREIQLMGEAFFEVQRNEEKPFVITTGQGLRTKVLGTSFGVRAYPGESEQKVAVLTGLVEVSTGQGLAFNIEPDKMAIYHCNQKSLKTSQFDIKAELGWKDNILYFNKQPLEAVFEKLERWYGVEISVDDQVNIQEPYSGQFQDETLTNVLEGICYTSGLDFKKYSDQISIYQP